MNTEYSQRGRDCLTEMDLRDKAEARADRAEALLREIAGSFPVPWLDRDMWDRVQAYLEAP